MSIRIISSLLAALAAILISCSKEQQTGKDIPAQERAIAKKAGGTSGADIALASRYVAKAEEFFKQSKDDSAIVYYKKASVIYETEANWENFVRCLTRIGRSYGRNNSYDSAMVCLNQALEIGRQRLGEDHAETGSAYQRIGVNYYLLSKDDQAIEFLNRAVKIHSNGSGKQDSSLATSYDYLGSIYTIRGDFNQALALCNKALSMRVATLGNQHADVAESYLNLAIVYSEMGDSDRALTLNEKSLEIFQAVLGEQHDRLTHVYSSLSIEYIYRGDYDKALELCLKDLSLSLNTLGEKHLRTAPAYGSLGQVYLMKDDYDQSITYLNKCLSIFLANGVEQHSEVATTYSALGAAYKSKGDLDQACYFYEKALSNYKNTIGQNNQYVVEVYRRLGSGYGSKGDYVQAFQYCAKALSIARSIWGAQNPNIAAILHSKGVIHNRKGDYKQAIKYYTQAISMTRASFGEHHPDLASYYNNTGNAYDGLDDYDRGLDYFQRAIRANVPAFSNPDPFANPPLHGILSEQSLIRSLYYKAWTMTQRYAKPSSQQRGGLEAAVSTYGLAFRLFDRMRTSYKAEGSKLVLAEFTTNMFDGAIIAARQLNRVTRENAPKELAFQWAEKSKSSILLDALAEAAAKRYAGIPDSLLEKERQLSLDLAFYDRVLAEEQLKRQAADSSKIALWQDKIFDLKKAYEALLQRFEKEYAAYYDLKYQANTVSVQEVQQQILDDDTALLEYFTGVDSLFIFVITPAAFEVTAVAKDSLFDKHIEQLRQRLIAQDVAGYSEPAHRLYQILLEPVAELVRGKNLIIIPDGVLCGVPFEALLTRQVEAKSNLPDHASLPYLLNDHAISYAYSATLLAQTLKKQRASMPRDYLAFAPVFAEGLPADTRGADFFKENFAHDSSQTAATRVRGYLPASKREVTGVLDRFNGRYGFLERWFGNKSHIYLQHEAREENLKSPALRDYRYVHFATHGLVNEKNPKLSGLLLAQEDSTSNEDGILHLGEIYNLNLNADLVVLSACETGLGQVAKGEGIIGLTRGFLYAGASNLLVSLWQVSDVTTADLMVDFYDKMLGGMSKSEALREAKLQMIRRHPEYAKPYYWAPFILVGK